MIIPIKNKTKLPKDHNIYTRDLHKVDNDKFFLDLLDIDLDEISNIPNAHDAFIKLFDDYIPLRKITNNEFKRRYKPWISKGILISINRKNKLYKKYIKCANNDSKLLIFNEYKTLKKQINELERLGKKNTLCPLL